MLSFRLNNKHRALPKVLYARMSIAENIRKHGWQFQFIFDESGERQDFGYTIGFEESFGHPEIMIFGLPRETMHAILDDLAQDIRSGKKITPNERVPKVLAGDFEVLFKPIRQEFLSEYAGTATDYYQDNIRVYVMFWPDEENVLPTEDHCDVSVQNEALGIV